MSLIESLLLLLLLSRVLGEFAARVKQPSMLGEIAAGILLGPSCFALIHFTHEIKAIADLGVLLLVFLAGMEMDLDALSSSFGVGAHGSVQPDSWCPLALEFCWDSPLAWTTHAQRF